jgi:AcrR family transcriptional regulator
VRRTDAASDARRARGGESRQRLLEAATALIGERGYGATSVNDICRRAGVAKTALYWHFEGKEGLLAAVIESLGGRWIEELQKRAYLRALPHERLEELVRGWREILEQEPQLVRLPLFLQLEAQGASEEIRDALRGLSERSEAAIRQGLEDSLGLQALADSSSAAHTVLSLLEALVVRAGLARDDAERDGLYGALTRSIVHVVWAHLREDARARLAGLP